MTTNANRDDLLKILLLVRPALATQSFIPALMHLKFGGGYVTAYNDVSAISCKLAIADEIGVCVPGEMLIRALSSFASENVACSIIDDSTLLLAAGRSKMRVPTVAVKDFPLKAIKGDASVVSVDNDILEGIKRCLVNVGNDPTHPAQMGVTVDVEDGRAVLFSTDNLTISRFRTKSKIKLPGDSPLILPTFFCEQLVTLARAYPDDDIDLDIYPNAVQARFGKKATLLTKTVVDLEPMDFGKVIARLIPGGDVKEHLCRIPDAFDAAWNRALLVQSEEKDKSTLVEAGKETFHIYSRSPRGESDDELTFAGQVVRKDFYVDPVFVLRGAKSCGSIAFYDKVMVLATDDGQYIHLVSHCTP